MIAEVMIRRGKYLNAIRAVNCGLKNSPDHPTLTVALVKVRGQLLYTCYDSTVGRIGRIQFIEPTVPSTTTHVIITHYKLLQPFIS